MLNKYNLIFLPLFLNLLIELLMYCFPFSNCLYHYLNLLSKLCLAIHFLVYDSGKFILKKFSIFFIILKILIYNLLLELISPIAIHFLLILSIASIILILYEYLSILYFVLVIYYLKKKNIIQKY